MAKIRMKRVMCMVMAACDGTLIDVETPMCKACRTRLAKGQKARGSDGDVGRHHGAA